MSEKKKIHGLHNGRPLCGFSDSLPGDWPENDVWVSVEDLAEGPQHGPDREVCGVCDQLAKASNPKPV